jgi:hypothetical protein
MGRTCSIVYWWGEKCAWSLSETWKEETLGYLSVGRIILKWITQNFDVMIWTGCNWARLRSSEPWRLLKDGEFFDQMSSCQFLIKVFTPWSSLVVLARKYSWHYFFNLLSVSLYNIWCIHSSDDFYCGLVGYDISSKIGECRCFVVWRNILLLYSGCRRLGLGVLRLYERGTHTNLESGEEIEPCLGLWVCVQAHVKLCLFEGHHAGKVIKWSYVEAVHRNVVMGGGNYCV